MDINRVSNEHFAFILDMADREEAFYLFVDLYAAVTDEERTVLRAQWPFGRQWIFPDFTTLSWTIAGKKTPRERIWAALLCICILCDGCDLRDYLVSVSTIYHHTLRVERPEKLFSSAILFAKPECGGIFDLFINPNVDEASKDLERYGLILKSTPDGDSIVFKSSIGFE